MCLHIINYVFFVFLATRRFVSIRHTVCVRVTHATLRVHTATCGPLMMAAAHTHVYVLYAKYNVYNTHTRTNTTSVRNINDGLTALCVSQQQFEGLVHRRTYTQTYVHTRRDRRTQDLCAGPRNARKYYYYYYHYIIMDSPMINDCTHNACVRTTNATLFIQHDIQIYTRVYT